MVLEAKRDETEKAPHPSCHQDCASGPPAFLSAKTGRQHLPRQGFLLEKAEWVQGRVPPGEWDALRTSCSHLRSALGRAAGHGGGPGARVQAMRAAVLPSMHTASLALESSYERPLSPESHIQRGLKTHGKAGLHPQDLSSPKIRAEENLWCLVLFGLVHFSHLDVIVCECL